MKIWTATTRILILVTIFIAATTITFAEQTSAQTMNTTATTTTTSTTAPQGNTTAGSAPQGNTTAGSACPDRLSLALETLGQFMRDERPTPEELQKICEGHPRCFACAMCVVYEDGNGCARCYRG
jgi:hypothetical protein